MPENNKDQSVTDADRVSNIQTKISELNSALLEAAKAGINVEVGLATTTRPDLTSTPIVVLRMSNAYKQLYQPLIARV